MKWPQLLGSNVPAHPCTDINLEEFYRISDSTDRNKLIDLFWRTYFSSGVKPNPEELLEYHSQILFRELELKYDFLEYFYGITDQDKQEIEFLDTTRPIVESYKKEAEDYIKRINSPKIDKEKIKIASNATYDHDLSKWYYKNYKIPPAIPDVLEKVAPNRVELNHKEETHKVALDYYEGTEQNQFKHHTSNIEAGILSAIFTDAITMIKDQINQGIPFDPFTPKDKASQAVKHYEDTVDEDYSAKEKAYEIQHTYRKRVNDSSKSVEKFNRKTVLQAVRRANKKQN